MEYDKFNNTNANSPAANVDPHYAAGRRVGAALEAGDTGAADVASLEYLRNSRAGLTGTTDTAFFLVQAIGLRLETMQNTTCDDGELDALVQELVELGRLELTGPRTDLTGAIASELRIGANMLADRGRLDAALGAVGEAREQILDPRVNRDGDRLHSLIGIGVTQAGVLAEQGSSEAAIAQAAENLELARELAEHDPAYAYLVGVVESWAFRLRMQSSPPELEPVRQALSAGDSRMAVALSEAAVAEAHSRRSNSDGVWGLALALSQRLIALEAADGATDEMNSVAVDFIEVLRELPGSRSFLSQTLNNHADDLVLQGRPQEALPLCDEALELMSGARGGDDSDDLSVLECASQTRAEALAELGRIPEAITELDTTTEIARELVELDEGFAADLQEAEELRAEYVRRG